MGRPFLLLAGLACVAFTARAGGACDDEALSKTLAPAATTAADARVLWRDDRFLRWPGADVQGRFRLLHSARGALRVAAGESPSGFDAAWPLKPGAAADDPRLRWAGAGIDLELPAAARARLRSLLQGQLVVVREDERGRVLDATHTQTALALDSLYAAAASGPEPGAQVRRGRTTFRLWAPTAQRVSLCLYPGPEAPASRELPMRREAAGGSWSAEVARDLSGRYYRFVVDVHVPGSGLVRNLVTDPWSTSLNADSRRSHVTDLGGARLKPPGWDHQPRPAALASQTDMVVYELHVRDFSIGDTSVPAARRGKYLAFEESASRGMQHLRALAAAGVTDLHLLPVFDFASVPERGCVTPQVQGAPDGAGQQAAVREVAARDCFNWGYDPWHFGAPEGSYASDAEDGAVRVLEFRRMVQALHAAGLRVGLDLVYNHTHASGQDPRSVLDRIVPGYYHRRDAKGAVERSTCCENTATEHRMMARLMIDTAVRWVRHYGVDSFRFDLMGHQPRAAMEALQRAVDAAAGRRVNLIGEGWNFGEVADGRRFVQASQLSLGGSGIATFSDRARDAARGGGAGDDGEDQVLRQGWLNGLFFDPNALAAGRARREDLLKAADLVRTGLAGTLAGYRLPTAGGTERPLSEVDYAGQSAGYAAEPAEVVNYVENHDNQTLWDINVFKLPRATPAAERARVQVLGTALVAFSQGVAYLHAGQELLRSKSMDRNSFDSGDAFNRLDWTFTDNGFGAGLPPEPDNGRSWPLMRPLLADPALKPGPAEIAFARGAVLDLLRIRASTTLLRLRSAADVRARLRFHDTGPGQAGSVVVGQVDGRGYPGAVFGELVYLVNAGRETAEPTLESLKGRAYRLHPVHLAAGAADPRPAQALYDPVSGRFSVPARTAVVFVAP